MKESAEYSPLSPGSYTVTFSESGVAEIEGQGVNRHHQVRTLIDDSGISLAFGTVLPQHLADLLDLTVAAYVADRLCVRRPREGKRIALDDLWQRRITVRVPLRNPSAWTQSRCKKLELLLSFLTDDLWTFEPTLERPTLRPSEVQPSLFSEVFSIETSTVLLSGGLDSLAGIVSELTNFPTRTIIAFSARTNGRIGKYQRLQVSALNSLFGPRIRHVPVHIKLRGRSKGAYDGEEPSQRTRGFVFQIFGAVTAAMAGGDFLHVYENGIGSLNVPYSAAQLGSQATRATNPITVALASDLLTDVIGSLFRVLLPHQFDTKGEMCSIFRNGKAAALIPHAISCDNFPQRVAAKPQCGICPSCLLTRQSLQFAGLRAADESSRYRLDIYSDSSVEDNAYHLRVMSAQAAKIAEGCAAPNPWKELVRSYPLLFDVAQDAISRTGCDPSDQIIALYKRYCAEWESFWSEVTKRTRAVA